jgi:hypothetical protein
MNYQPCPPCEPAFPIFCDPLPTTNEGKRIVVEDSASCQKTIQTPTTQSLFGVKSTSNIGWIESKNDSLVCADSTGNIEFRDGSLTSPIKLSNIASDTAYTAPSIIVMLADGSIQKWKPNSTTDNFIAYWDGTEKQWKTNSLNNLLPSGQGVLIRNTSGSLAVVSNGVSGSTLQMVGTSIQFVSSGLSQLPAGHIYGLVLSNDSTLPNDDINITTGQCRSADNTADIVLTSSITKKTTSVWAQGTNQGGMDTGVKPANGTLHVYAISNGATNDVIFSQDPSSPQLPGGYTKYRRIGSVTTDGASAVRQFKQYNDRFLYTGKPIADATNAAVSAGGSPFTLTVPNGIKVFPMFNCYGPNLQLAYDLDSTWTGSNTPAATNGAGNVLFQSNNGGSSYVGMFGIATNTARQIGIDVSVNTTVYIDTYGWFDNRGRHQ